MAGNFADLVSAGDALKVAYPSKIVVAQLNEMRPFTKKIHGGLPAGATIEKSGILKFNMNFERPQNVGQQADDDSLPIPGDRIEKQGTLTPTLFTGTFIIGSMTRSSAASSPKAGFNGGELKRRTDETVADVGKNMEQTFVGTHGTGRRARVEAATSAVVTFTAALPEGTTLLRVNHLISIRTTDGGASVRDSCDNQRIAAINPSTRLVTLTSSTFTLVAGDHVHIVTKASQTITSIYANGLRGLVDNGTFLATVHGLSRATYPKLNAYVNDNGGTLRDFTEKLLNRSCNAIAAGSGVYPTDMWTSPGQAEKWADFVRPDRRYMVTGKTSPQGKQTGYTDEELTHISPGGVLRLNVSFDIIPRELYLLHWPAWIRYTAKEAGWWDEGNILKPVPATGTYKSSYMAAMEAIENIGCDFFGAQGVIRDLRDPAIGDTDPA